MLLRALDSFENKVPTRVHHIEEKDPRSCITMFQSRIYIAAIAVALTAATTSSTLAKPKQFNEVNEGFS